MKAALAGADGRRWLNGAEGIVRFPRIGVATRLVAPIVALAALTGVAGVIAVVFVAETQDRIEALTGDQMAALVAVSGLMAASQSVVANAPSLAVSESQFARQTARFQIEEQLDELVSLQRAVTGYAAAEVHAEPLDFARMQLSDSIDQLDTAVNRQITLLTRQDAQWRTSQDIKSELLFFSLDEPSGWHRQAEAAVDLLIAARSASDRRALRELSARFDERLASLDGMQGAPPDAAVLTQRIATHAAADNGVFATAEALINNRRQVRATLSGNRIFADRYLARVSETVRSIERQAVRLTEEGVAFEQAVSNAMFALALIGAVAATGIGAYVVRGPVRRLVRLQEAMSRARAGETPPPRQHVNDEIGDLGRAFDYYVAVASEREARLQRVLQSSPVGALISTADGEILFSNPRSRKLLGFADNSAVSMGDFWPSAEDRADFNHRLMSDGGYYDLEFAMVAADGARLWALCSGEPITFDGRDGDIMWIYDITSRKRAEELIHQQQKRLESITRNVPGAVFRIRRDCGGEWRLDFVSDGAAGLFGVQAESLGDAPGALFETVGEDAGARLRAGLDAAARDAAPVNLECEIERSDAPSVALHFLSGPPSDEPEGLVWDGLILDVTAQKQAEQAKRSFISTVSHELRTPLTAIRGSLGLIAGGAFGDMPDKARGMIDIAAKNAERLTRLINDILDIEKIEADKVQFDFDDHSLGALLETAVEANAGYGVERGVTVRLEKPDKEITVRVDADRFMQVMANLVSNAIKFSPDGAAVTVQTRRMDDTVRVAVIDCGSGIPESFRSRIFERFSQAESGDNRSKGGTGLGLSIARAIVERFGGQIGFDTERGKGTAFYFDLPIFASADDPDAGPLALITLSARSAAETLAADLSVAGFRTAVEISLRGARARLQDDRVDALVLDALLYDGSGVAFVRELRAESALRDLPIILVASDEADAPDEAARGALDIQDWILTASGPDGLGERVRRALTGALSRPSESGRPRVLHVEDDPDVTEIVEAMVGGEAEVVSAATMAEARRSLLERRFDLVIIDIGLPDGDGLDLLPDLETRTGRPGPPVIVFSASEPDDAVAARVAEVLTKSKASNAALIAAVRRLLQDGSQTPEELAHAAG